MHQIRRRPPAQSADDLRISHAGWQRKYKDKRIKRSIQADSQELAALRGHLRASVVEGRISAKSAAVFEAEIRLATDAVLRTLRRAPKCSSDLIWSFIKDEFEAARSDKTAGQFRAIFDAVAACGDGR
jgi:hypothetical protein